jgi:EAL domain-containing protein (putative c-di-GMP-specific phosphodiesterase class I)
VTALAESPVKTDFSGLTTALEPIVSLHDGSVVAFEALSRLRVGGLGIAQVFERAEKRGESVELNLAAIHSALGTAETLPANALLFVNADPAVLSSSRLPSVVREGAENAAFPLTRLVIEITERSALFNVSAAMRVLDELRMSGVRFAFDDFGSAHSHLSHIQLIRPSFLKIGHGFGTAFEQSITRTHIVRHIAGLARDFGCRTILEGVESADTALAGRNLGIEYAQGYHFARPVLPFDLKWVPKGDS